MTAIPLLPSEEERRVEAGKRSLLDLSLDELTALLADLGQPAYRARQVWEWIYRRFAGSFDEMTSLPKELRSRLAEMATVTPLTLALETVSADRDTQKVLFQLPDGQTIETVLMLYDKRRTLCISSQAGCAMGCTFCATGWGGFDRQLTAGEIVSQYRASRRWAEEHGLGPISNIVYMGMGEPLANRKSVHPSLTILNEGYGVGARRITVSTVGVVPGILELADRPEQFRLALSLHAPSSELRRELIPLEKRHSLDEVMASLEKFDDRGGKRITFEYTMIDGVNDDLDLIAPLADLALRVRAFVNLIPFNPIPYQDWRPSSAQRIRAYAEALESRGVSVAIRETRGRDIDAACGQLRGHTLVQIQGASTSRNEPGTEAREGT